MSAKCGWEIQNMQNDMVLLGNEPGGLASDQA